MRARIKLYIGKAEKILKGSLDLIPSPSPSVKVQIMGGKGWMGCKCTTLLGNVKKLYFQKFVDKAQQHYDF